MEITSKTKYDKKAITALCHLSMFRKKNPKKGMRMLSLLYGCIFVYVLLVKLWLGNHFHGALPILLFCAGAYTLMLYSYYLVPRIQYKNLAKRQDTEQTYTFTENGFTVTNESDLWKRSV